MFGDTREPLTRNLYIYGNANPMTYVDPSGHFAFIPLLIKAGANGAADLMLQATMNYLFNPKTQGNVEASFGAVNWWQVTRSAAEGLIPWKTPGGRLGRAAVSAVGDVLVNAAHQGRNYSGDQALLDFATGFIGDLAGGGLGDLVNKYGAVSVAKGLKKIGFDDAKIKKLTGTIAVKTLRYIPTSGVKLKTISNKTTTVLGRFEKDIVFIIKELNLPKSLDFSAKPNGFNILNAPNDLYKNADQFWKEYNLPFLDQAIARGDEILLATKPIGDAIKNLDGKPTGFGREYSYLLKKGYHYDPVGNKMTK
jgi:hypothetical protein